MKALCHKTNNYVAIKICITDHKHNSSHNHEIAVLQKLKLWHDQRPGPDNDGVEYVMKLLRTVSLNSMGIAICMPLYRTNL